MTAATVRIPFVKIYIHPRGQQSQCDGGGLSGLVCVPVRESHLAQMGGGVGWGQAGSDFQLQNGLMQFVLLILSLMLGCTPARTKRSQNAKVEFKHQHPCPATGSPKGPCKGYVIDHIVPIACHGADELSNMQWQAVADDKAKDKWERKVSVKWSRDGDATCQILGMLLGM